MDESTWTIWGISHPRDCVRNQQFLQDFRKTNIIIIINVDVTIARLHIFISVKSYFTFTTCNCHKASISKLILP